MRGWPVNSGIYENFVVGVNGDMNVSYEVILDILLESRLNPRRVEFHYGSGSFLQVYEK